MKKRILRKGQRRTIYIDPFTEKVSEGKAVLIQKLSDSIRSEFWQVMFVSDDTVCQRKIRVN